MANLLIGPTGKSSSGRHSGLFAVGRIEKTPNSSATALLGAISSSSCSKPAVKKFCENSPRATKPLDEQIIRCLDLFETAESEVALRPYVYQAVAAFREASRSHKKNTQPWLLLFDQLGSEGNRSSDGTFTVSLESESPTVAGPEA